MEHAEQELNEREKPWEQRLAEQREKDEEDRRDEEKEKHEKILMNKRDPHLTNLNEDPQLSGKLYYNLAKLAESPAYVGRQGGEPKPQITMRGVGIQQNHCKFEVCPNGQIKLCLTGQDSFENTLINGERLKPVDKQTDQLLDFSDTPGGDQTYEQILHHLDRLCFGGALFFLFRYPLERQMKAQMASSIDDNVDPEEAESMVNDLKLT